MQRTFLASSTAAFARLLTGKIDVKKVTISIIQNLAAMLPLSPGASLLTVCYVDELIRFALGSFSMARYFNSIFDESISVASLPVSRLHEANLSKSFFSGG